MGLVVGGAVIGLLWSAVLGLIAGRLCRRDSWKPYLANAPVLVAIIATGLLIGGGYMYGFLMNAALGEPPTTYATLSALMQPTVPYYIVVNTLMEALIIPLVVFLNLAYSETQSTYTNCCYCVLCNAHVDLHHLCGDTARDLNSSTLDSTCGVVQGNNEK